MLCVLFPCKTKTFCTCLLYLFCLWVSKFKSYDPVNSTSTHQPPILLELLENTILMLSWEGAFAGYFLTYLRSSVFFCFFFLGEKGKIRMPATFTSRVICHPLVNVTVNICVTCEILPEIQVACNEGGYYRNVFKYTFQASGEC